MKKIECRKALVGYEWRFTHPEGQYDSGWFQVEEESWGFYETQKRLSVSGFASDVGEPCNPVWIARDTYRVKAKEELIKREYCESLLEKFIGRCDC